MPPRLPRLWRTRLSTNLPVWVPAAYSVWSREQPILRNDQDSNLLRRREALCLTPDE
ncbi:hypothetical protein CGRA01v4_04536 [Colletotrichum graminicola]|nr:hypothetical protein CGRA01v4_04536 [Colletotrichum graminicola]